MLQVVNIDIMQITITSLHGELVMIFTYNIITIKLQIVIVISDIVTNAQLVIMDQSNVDHILQEHITLNAQK